MIAAVPDEWSDEETGSDDRAAEGIAHLQAAAKELIHAARAMLDVAEDLVDDPGAVSMVADAFGTAFRTAASAGRRAAGFHQGAEGAHSDDEAHRSEPESRGVKRIRVG